MRGWNTLIASMLLALLLASCAPGQVVPTATPQAIVAPTSEGIISTPTSTSFGTVTLSGAQAGTFEIETVSAFALDGNVTLMLGMEDGRVVVFDLPLDLLQPGRVELGDPDSAPAFASLAPQSGPAYVSTSGGITFSQTDETFAAEFAFEAGEQIEEGIAAPDLTISGTVSDIRVADESG
jgi:hypothetical protein